MLVHIYHAAPPQRARGFEGLRHRCVQAAHWQPSGSPLAPAAPCSSGCYRAIQRRPQSRACSSTCNPACPVCNPVHPGCNPMHMHMRMHMCMCMSHVVHVGIWTPRWARTSRGGKCLIWREHATNGQTSQSTRACRRAALHAACTHAHVCLVVAYSPRSLPGGPIRHAYDLHT